MFDTPEQARAFLKRAGLLNTRRVIEGEEREKTLTMLRLIKSEVSNNQRFWTESWTVGNISYALTTGEGIDELTEIIEDDI
jgi:hypothetical protein